MLRLLFIVVMLGIAAWYAKEYFQHKNAGGSYELNCTGSGHKNRECTFEKTYSLSEQASSSQAVVINQDFRCDGRTHCSQMTSCAEATYFLKNCPNTKMDGDGNGVPCERQWCR